VLYFPFSEVTLQFSILSVCFRSVGLQTPKSIGEGGLIGGASMATTGAIAGTIVGPEGTLVGAVAGAAYGLIGGTVTGGVAHELGCN
jgi:hypothetical protein